MFNTALFLFSALFSPAALADGACCNPDEEFCIYTAEDVCVGDGGYYYGDGVDCSADFVECEVEDSSMGSTTDPDPDPDLEGACCVEDTCIDAMLEDDCKHELGTWYAGMDCGDLGAECEGGDPDPDLGACCLDADADGISECVDAVTNDWCSHNFGTWYAGQDCVAVGAECELGDDTGDIPDPDLGACCREDTCIDDVPEDECKDVGTWYPGASCDDLVAECGLDDDTGIIDDPDLGACCLDEECIETTAEECWADEGAFYGPGSTCDAAFVECCGDDTGTTGPVDPVPSLSCSSTGGSRSGLHLMLPLALVGLAAGFRRREVR
jgi:MYXO-CTERM domain-containing protein